MTKDEALKLALEALEQIHHDPKGYWNCHDDITAIKEALAQPEQPTEKEKISRKIIAEIAAARALAQPEQALPVWTRCKTYQAGHNAGVAHHKQATKREWVGLTDDDIFGCVRLVWGDRFYPHAADLLAFARTVETKSKEKNT